MMGGGLGLNYGTSTPRVSFDLRSSGDEPTAADGDRFKSILLMLLPAHDPALLLAMPAIYRIIDHNSAYWEEQHRP